MLVFIRKKKKFKLQNEKGNTLKIFFQETDITIEPEYYESDQSQWHLLAPCPAVQDGGRVESRSRNNPNL